MSNRTVPEITELNLPHERGYMTIEDDGDTIKAIIRPDLAGAVATDRLRWLRASVVAAGEYLGKLCDKGQMSDHKCLPADLPPWRVELERLRGQVRKGNAMLLQEHRKMHALAELDARQRDIDAAGAAVLAGE